MFSFDTKREPEKSALRGVPFCLLSACMDAPLGKRRLPWMFSFDTKREPEKCQRFRRAGATKKGLLAPFNPKEVGYTGKN